MILLDLKFFRFFHAFLALSILFSSFVLLISSDQQCSHHTSPYEHRFLILISTLDGKISALNIENGQLEWSITTGDGPLLSSSIGNLEINHNGKPTRLIPSLDGGLYQFDGSSVEAVPFSADTLLSSSFKLSENSMIVGGKETETYGIDAKTGKIKYACDMNGCKSFSQKGEDLFIENSRGTLVITRQTKTVRTVTMTTGAEKWNFSVGEHEVSYVSEKLDSAAEIGVENSLLDEIPDLDEPDSNSQCSKDTPNSEKLFDFPWWSEDNCGSADTQIKVVVPKGTVRGMSHKEPSKMLWEYKFQSSVAKAWTLKDGVLTSVDLFDYRNIPALNYDHEEIYPETELPEGPALYIGVHNNQLYVQPSVKMMEAVEESINNAVFNGDTYPIQMPRVEWMPYIATATSRTPAELQRHPLQLPHKLNQESWDPNWQEESTDLALWREYPYDAGFYLYKDFEPAQLPFSNDMNKTDEGLFFEEPITVTLWNWWKEVVAITITVSVLMNVCVLKFFYKHPPIQTQVSEQGSQSKSESASVSRESSESQASNSESKSGEYESRYYMDFQHVKCLGKGGFGVVFQARNKMDDLDYAVKRISLVNSEKSKEKVMREVKALATLDHVGIVRYYQAWFESPPAGWQEEKDNLLFSEVSSTATAPFSHSEVSPSQSHIALEEKQRPSRSPKHNKQKVVQSNQSKPLLDNPLFQFQNNGDFDLSSTFNESSEFSAGVPFQGQSRSLCSGDQFCPTFSTKKGSTEPFTPLSNDDMSTDWHAHSSIDNSTSQQGVNQSRVLFDLCDTTSESGFTSHANGKKIDDSIDIIFEGSAENNTSDSIPSEHSKHGDSPAHVDILQKSKSLFVPHISSSIETPPIPTRAASIPCAQNKLENLKKEEKKIVSHPKLYLYIQMQMCQEESLKEWLAANTLNRNKDHLLSIFEQIMSAIAYVHQSGLMHRDLKPSNIFFSKDGSVKIGDFGLVTALEEQGDIEAYSSTELLKANSSFFRKHTDQVGTKLYMSPEQVEGRHYTHKVDIYASGLILFELFFPFSTQMERYKILIGVRKGEFPSRFSRELPQECQLAAHLLSHDPEDRPNASDILNHPLLEQFTSVMTRTRTNSRPRTISQDSNSSAKCNSSRSASRSTSESADKTE